MSAEFYDRWRIIIEEARTNKILVRDLKVFEPKVLKQLSGPSTIQFKIDPKSDSVRDDTTGRAIRFKPWGHWAHIERTTADGKREIVASGLFKPSVTDPKSGILDAEFTGFSDYPSGIPWLQNWNPIAVDPFEIVRKIWDHLQDYPNGDLGVEVFPDFSGTQMLPGFSFDGEDFVMDFFAIFIRAIDFNDCGDYINKLARDIPFDYFERSTWNADHTAIDKKIELAYPRGGVQQTYLAFRMGENVVEATPKLEADIEWTSDIIVRGWFPGKVYSYELSNADQTRYRRVIMEEDAKINSDERSEAWAHRQLTRRQVPFYWEKITVNMWHPNAPFGSYDVGDSIRVQGEMPWVGMVDQWHKVMAIAIDLDTNTCELTLRAEGAFSYDPIFYEGPDANRLANPSFVSNLSAWEVDGLWSRDPTIGSDAPGSARCTANGGVHNLISSGIPVTTGDEVLTHVDVKWSSLAGSGTPVKLLVLESNAAGDPVNLIQVGSLAYSASGGFTTINGTTRMVPSGITTVRFVLRVDSSATSGNVWFDKAFAGIDD